MTNPELTLYFSPLACSFASRAVLYEVGANAELLEVEHGKVVATGADYRTIHPLGLVPALVLPGGDLVTENAAVLQYLGDRFPAHRLTPADARERTRLHTWLSFIGTELHEAAQPGAR
jgi:glutathione S-transferase